jgi:hypothetical protein
MAQPGSHPDRLYTLKPQLLPGWVTTVLLAALLIFLATKLIRRGVRTYRSETAEQKAAAAAEPAAASDGDGNGDGAPGVAPAMPMILVTMSRSPSHELPH